ncbi:protein HBS1-like [Artemia franciscana]|uniref:protein HBS1-like n=1 Tax=Artemia franciscana TaxID=6661 RepID=UPI0032DB78B3
MSRHRNIRNICYEDEDYQYEDIYGHSVDDDYGTSPSVEQFIYDRSSQQVLSGFIQTNEQIKEEEEELCRGTVQVELSKATAPVEEKVLQIPLKSPSIEFGAPKAPSVISGPVPRPTTAKIVPATPKATIVSGFLVPSATPDKSLSPVSSAETSRSESPTNIPVVPEEKTAEHQTPLKPTKKKDVMSLYEKERSGAKDRLNLVVIGHVDAGKSTMMGHLLYELGEVSQKILHKYETESKKLGKQSFAYAWILDESMEERSRGVTMDVAQSSFETATKNITLLDAPGHKDFIPRMILGAAQADVAVLVVDATKGEFETGFESGGQTQEHALLIRTLGVSQLVVSINKMDTCDWSEERFIDIKKRMATFLKQIGFKEDEIKYIPVSGLSGVNLTRKPAEPCLTSWYKGLTLLEAIDAFRAPERGISKPLRLCVTDVYKGSGSSLNVGGRIESGMIATGDVVQIMPLGESASVKSISVNSVSITTAFAGDPVVVTLTGIDVSKVGMGNVICHSSSLVNVTTRFEARIVLFGIELPVIPGFPFELHYQGHTEPAIFKKLIAQVHKGTGEVLRKKPRVLTKNSSGIIEIEVNRPICIETYGDFRELGRFVCRSSGQTVAAGLVTKVL